MDGSSNRALQSFLDFYHEHGLSVYRFHLARCGDWQDAEELMRATFRRAQRWFSPKLSPRQAKVWLYRSAAFASIRPGKGMDADDGGMGISPTQEQMGQLARVSEVHESWRKVSRRKRDVFALFIFGGLEMAEVASVMSWRVYQVSETIGQLPGDVLDLQRLATQIQPVGYFVRRLENELAGEGHKLAGRKQSLARARWNWSKYQAGPALATLGKALPWVAVAAALVFTLWYFGLGGTAARPGAANPRTTPRVISEVGVANIYTDIDLSAFPPSQDSAILVSPEGGIHAYYLHKGLMTRLSKDGFFPKTDGLVEYPFQVSPDGAWLSLVNPNTSETWLLELNGVRQQKVADWPVRLAWSPDGQSAVYTLPENRRTLYRYDVSEGHSRAIAGAYGEILDAAWSPADNLIGLVIAKQVYGRDMREISLALYSPEAGQITQIVDSGDAIDQNHMGPDRIYRLLWTRDGRELWFPYRYESVSISEEFAAQVMAGTVQGYTRLKPRYLEANLAAEATGVNAFQRNGVSTSYNANLNSLLQGVFVSPDRSRAVALLESPNGTSNSLAVYPFDNPTENLWIRQFGPLAKVSWASDGQNLMAGEYNGRAGRIYRVDADTGQSMVIGNGYWLMGTVSELRIAALKQAPRSDKIRGAFDLEGEDTWVAAYQDLGIQFTLSPFIMASEFYRIGNVPTANLTNYVMGDPWGFVSLEEDDLLIVVQLLTGPTADINLLAHMMAQGDSQEAYGERIKVDGHEALRVDLDLAGDGEDFFAVYIQSGDGLLFLYCLPQGDWQREEFDQVVEGIRFIDE